VARGRLQQRPVGAVAPPAGTRYETWGIVLEIPQSPQDTGEPRSAVTDEGRILAVTMLPPEDTDPAAMLAAARYWELPSAYVRRLASAANAPVEEYVY